MSVFTRNGITLNGPRMIAALVVTTVLFLFLSRPHVVTSHILPSGSLRQTQEAPPPLDLTTAAPEPPSKGSLQDALEEPSAVSDQLFEYLKGHAPQSLRPAMRPDDDGDIWSDPATTPKKEGEGSSLLATDKSPIPDAAHIRVDMKGADPASTKDPICDHMDEVADLLVVIRAPAADLFEGLPMHLLSTFKCVDSLLFSTIAHNFNGHNSYDALANVSTSVKNSVKDFDLYRKIQEVAGTESPDLKAIKEDTEHNLDKFAIIPTILETHKMKPDKKWYMFIEGDTYLSIPNLVAWTSKMDPNKPIFAGAQVMIGDTELPHSGSGILMSSAAMQKLSLQAIIKRETWDEAVSQSCCGDKVLAEALKEIDIPLHKGFPLLQGETPFTLDWSSRHWCKAAITWHGMTPEMVDLVNEVERKWTEKYLATASLASSTLKNMAPLRFSSVFKASLLPEIAAHPNRTSWDNLASTYKYDDSSRAQYAHLNVDACRAACDLRQECLQYAWEPGVCRLGTVVRFGDKTVEAEGGEGRDVRSGWHLRRIETWVKAQDRACASGNTGAWEL